LIDSKEESFVIFFEFLKKNKIHINIASNLPVSKGLGSSASFLTA
jgi:mevalonate kinase